MLQDSPAAIHRIELNGDYDLSRRDELRDTLAEIDGQCPVVLDVRAVDYADSSFLSELGRLKTTHPACPIAIYGASPMMKKLLAIVSFDKLFTIAESH